MSHPKRLDVTVCSQYQPGVACSGCVYKRGQHPLPYLSQDEVRHLRKRIEHTLNSSSKYCLHESLDLHNNVLSRTSESWTYHCMLVDQYVLDLTLLTFFKCYSRTL